jgi:hypothetical protein
MTKICGIELKASEAILAVVEQNNGNIQYVNIATKKIKIGNHEDSQELRSFYESFCNFIRDNHIDLIVIKQRQQSGQFAGGAVSFKLEAIIQLNNLIEVVFVSGQSISASNRRKNIDLPASINKYQEQAYSAIVTYLRKAN